MQLHIHIHHHRHISPDLTTRIFSLLNKIKMTNQELVDGLNAVNDKLQKIGAESTDTLQKVSDLEAALGNIGDVSPEVQSALEALKTQAQIVDDLVPDAVETSTGDEPPAETPTEDVPADVPPADEEAMP